MDEIPANSANRIIINETVNNGLDGNYIL